VSFGFDGVGQVLHISFIGELSKQDERLPEYHESAGR
jgi:hypothetical protein